MSINIFYIYGLLLPEDVLENMRIRALRRQLLMCDFHTVVSMDDFKYHLIAYTQVTHYENVKYCEAMKIVDKQPLAAAPDKDFYILELERQPFPLTNHYWEMWDIKYECMNRIGAYFPKEFPFEDYLVVIKGMQS